MQNELIESATEGAQRLGKGRCAALLRSVQRPKGAALTAMLGFGGGCAMENIK